jgi:hypothetical protein
MNRQPGGSIAVVGLVHPAGNAAGFSLIPHLYSRPGDGATGRLAMLGPVVMVATRGRLGVATGSDPRSRPQGRPGRAGARSAVALVEGRDEAVVPMGECEAVQCGWDELYI